MGCTNIPTIPSLGWFNHVIFPSFSTSYRVYQNIFTQNIYILLGQHAPAAFTSPTSRKLGNVFLFWNVVDCREEKINNVTKWVKTTSSCTYAPIIP